MSDIEIASAVASSDADYRIYVKRKLGEIVPVLAHSAVGDYSVDVPLDEIDDDLGEIFAGIQFLLEAVRDQLKLIEHLEARAIR